VISRRNKTISAGIALILSATLLALGAAPAVAAPELGVSLSRDMATVSHTDERVDYLVGVKNAAPVVAGLPQVGDTLSCTNGKNAWSRESTTNYDFQFRWVRNGVPATDWADPSASIEGVTIATYTAQAADAGAAIQCLVKGTNGTGSGSGVVASQPAVVIAPAPAVAPPVPNGPTSTTRRPAISGSAKNANDELTCTAPTAGWSKSNEASPISWSFEWLRNGVTASEGTVTETTATTSKFKIAAGELASKAAFQCLAEATNTGGSALVESIVKPTEGPLAFTEQTEDGAPFTNSTAVPQVERATNTILLPLTLEVELPGGSGTQVYETSGSGWSCNKVIGSGSQHAKAICTITRLVKPGESLPQLRVAAALGADAPDLAVARAVAFGGGAQEVASDENVFAFGPTEPFALTSFSTAVLHCDGTTDYTVAGGHPCIAEGDFAFTRKRVLDPTNPSNTVEVAPIEQIRQNVTDLPRGFVGNPTAIPVLCETTEEVQVNTCPPGSRIGGIKVVTSSATNTSPIYAIEPENGTPAQFAFIVPGAPPPVYTLSAYLRPDDGYAASLELAPSLQANVYEAEVTLCDYGVKAGTAAFPGCKEPDDPAANPKPLISAPTRCDHPPVTRTRFSSWEQPERWVEAISTDPAITECDKVPFQPEVDLAPTLKAADSPTGLDIELSMPTEGLEKVIGCHEKQGDENSPLVPECVSQAQMKKSRIVFPEGMAINASAGHGLHSCSAAEIKLGTNDPISCPESSKIGTMDVATPLLREALSGNIYVAKQGDVNGALIGIYLVLESKRNGILVKVPGTVEANEKTGRLVAIVDELPEAPFSEASLHFPSGPRATLLTPPKCGRQTIRAELFPWTGGAPAVSESSFDVNTGPNGGPCPSGALDPKLNAGTTDPTAGKTSPFVLHLTREDGSQRFSGLTVKTPPGLSGYLKGIAICPQSTIDAISRAAGSGQGEIEHPSCPAASQVGTATAGAGAGSNPLFVDTGKVYLSGPYKGAPLSFAVVTPAVAGPLDLGNVVVQAAANVDPETFQITTVADSVPTIVHGILLDLRDIRIALDRPGFVLNPTNCEPLSLGAEVKGDGGGRASLNERFQVNGCENLKFKPNLSFRLIGGTKRGDHPKIRAVYRTHPGEANVARVSVTIPRSEFLDQAHIRTICTRVQFAAKACPPGSIYGHVTATSPLVDYTVSGPVYLRSSNNKLPDLVMDLHGPDYQPVQATIAGRVDSIKGQIRVTFESTPDLPVSKLVFTQQGGKKGLLINSRDVCASKNRATVELTAQNGLTHNFRPVVVNGKCGKMQKAERKRHRRGG